MGHLRSWFRASIFPEALRLAQLLICGLVAAAFWVAVEVAKALDLVSAAPLGLPWSFLVFVAGLIVCLFVADARRVARYRRELIALQTPRVDAVFDPSCDGCIWDHEAIGLRRIRIGIVNLSAATIHGVTVSLASISPRQQLVLPAVLNPTHGLTIADDGSFNLPNSSHHVHTELIKEQWDKLDSRIHIEFYRYGSVPHIPSGDYNGLLLIKGDETAEREVSFRITHGELGRPMLHLENQRQTKQGRLPA